MSKNLTVKDGIKLAVTHPAKGAAILARTVASQLEKESWLNDEFKLKFCILFVNNLIDGSVEKSIDPDILKKIKKRTFIDGLKLLRKRPLEGMKYMLVIIMEELRNRQGFSSEDQFLFYESLLKSFFPEKKISDFQKIEKLKNK